MTYRLVLSNSIIDALIQTLMEWRIIFQQYTFRFNNDNPYPQGFTLLTN